MNGNAADTTKKITAGLTALIQEIFRDGHELVTDGSLYTEIGPFVSQTSTDPVSPEQLAARFCSSHQALYDEAPSVLDYACGGATYRGMLQHAGFVWRGVHPAVIPGAAGPDVDVCDSLRLPYDDASFDAVFAFQVLCYLRDPDLAFAEIARVLKPNGILFGAAGYLEQVHDYSLINFTPIGLKAVALKAGLRLEEIHPAYDVLSWMFHRLRTVTTARHDLQDLIRRDNFFHHECVTYGRRLGRSAAEINLLKLTLSPHMSFLIRKPG